MTPIERQILKTLQILLTESDESCEGNRIKCYAEIEDLLEVKESTEEDCCEMPERITHAKTFPFEKLDDFANQKIGEGE